MVILTTGESWVQEVRSLAGASAILFVLIKFCDLVNFNASQEWAFGLLAIVNGFTAVWLYNQNGNRFEEMQVANQLTRLLACGVFIVVAHMIIMNKEENVGSDPRFEKFKDVQVTLVKQWNLMMTSTIMYGGTRALINLLLLIVAFLMDFGRS